MKDKMSRLGMCVSLTASMVLLIFALAASPAGAVEKHVLDQTLSLRGDCTINALDEIPDPGLCPGALGVDHPPKPLERPCGVATDRHGDIYVASPGFGLNGHGTEGRIDVFDPQGNFITEIKDEKQPCGLAVDSEGNLYVIQQKRSVNVYEPDSYPPTTATDFGSPTLVYEPAGEVCKGALNAESVGVDPSNDHLYISQLCYESESGIAEYGSAVEGWPKLKGDIGLESGAQFFKSVDVYGKDHAVYVTAADPNGPYGQPEGQRVYIFDGIDGHKKCEIDGTETPAGHFGFAFGNAGVAVDQSNGDVYVVDSFRNDVVVQFDADCHFVAQLPKPPKLEGVDPWGDIAVDTPTVEGEAGYDSPNEGHVYVTSGLTAPKSRLWAFAPVAPPKAPEVEAQAASGITETEATLSAKVNPNGIATSYHFEYVTESDFEANGYAGAIDVPVPEGDAGAGITPKAVSASISGLLPGSAYRFRLVATNHCDEAEPTVECVTLGEGKAGEEGEDSAFTTYLPGERLADNRAYELVTPPDTNGHAPTMTELGGGGFNIGLFNTSLVSPDGGGIAFGVEGGSLPVLGGGGYHDTYEALRGPGGWQNHFTGISGAQGEEPHPGGIAFGHGYSFWGVEGINGSLAPGNSTGKSADYVRRSGGVINPACSPEPEGLFEYIGCGSLGSAPSSHGDWISPDGDHIIFDASEPLEPCASPAGSTTVYDRTLDGLTHCVSLLPSGLVPAGGSEYVGATEDGSTVAFSSSEVLYARRADTTLEVATGDPKFGGLSQSGERLIYLRPNPGEPKLAGTQVPQGDIFICDLGGGGCAGEGAHAPIAIGSGEESVLVNVSADGSHVYFASPKRLDEAGEGQPDKDNLYVWSGTSIRLVAVLAPLDLVSTNTTGLARWFEAIRANPNRNLAAASDPSRSTPGGEVLVFESRVEPTGQASDGHPQTYRYEDTAAAGTRMTCLSCNPTGAAAGSDAKLQFDPGSSFTTPLPPLNAMTPVANVTADGTRVFFQTADPLVVNDVDAKSDVYEWEALGTGGCGRAGGCIHLISSGRSADDDYLYAVSPSGKDVFFESGDLLVPEDTDPTPSIYDARIGGGFATPAPPSGECLGEACQPSVVAPREPDSAVEGPGNPTKASKARCPRGKRVQRRAGKNRCVAKHAKHRRHRHERTDSKGRAPR